MGSTDILSRLADTLTEQRSSFPPVVLRQGRVENVNANGTVNITLGGSLDIIPGVHRLDSYGPIQFETIWVIVNGQDMLVIGTNTPHGWNTYIPAIAAIDLSGNLTGTTTVGNGIIQGAFKRQGNTLQVRGTLTLGSTTAFAANGRVLFYLPNGYVFAGTGNEYPLVSACAFDASDVTATGTYAGVARGHGGQLGNHSQGFLITFNQKEVTGGVSSPIPWTTGDVISWAGSVEIV